MQEPTHRKQGKADAGGTVRANGFHQTCRGSGDGMQAQGNSSNTGSPSGDRGRDQLATRERQAGPCGVTERGAADKAANLARWKSLCRQLPVFGRPAYPVRAEATKHVLPGCKSLGCPAALCAAVGTTWETSKLGGLNIKKCLQPRKHPPREVVFADRSGKPTQTSLGEGR
jgi:hypothetical protein